MLKEREAGHWELGNGRPGVLANFGRKCSRRVAAEL